MGPLTGLAFMTFPWASMVTSSTTVPEALVLRANSGNLGFAREIGTAGAAVFAATGALGCGCGVELAVLTGALGATEAGFGSAGTTGAGFLSTTGSGCLVVSATAGAGCLSEESLLLDTTGGAAGIGAGVSILGGAGVTAALLAAGCCAAGSTLSLVFAVAVRACSVLVSEDFTFFGVEEAAARFVESVPAARSFVETAAA